MMWTGSAQGMLVAHLHRRGPFGPWSTVLDAGHGPHGVGMIVDRAGLDWMGPRSMPPSVPDRPVRPTAKGAEPSSDSVPFIVCDYARSFFILLAAFL